MMLNPIRRIIETYVVFNGKEDFYKNNKDAKNLFNTNSHYFPDLEADLNGKGRDDIKNMLKKCFSDNGAEVHPVDSRNCLKVLIKIILSLASITPKKQSIYWNEKARFIVLLFCWE